VWVIAIAIGCGGHGAASDAGGGDGRDLDGATAPDGPTDAVAATCGNGTRECGEECDDGASNGAPGDPCDATCRIAPYSGAPQAAVDALHAMNALRARACVPGAQLESHVVASSQNHATYYATNAAAYAGGLSPHQEASGYPGYTGVNFYDRMTAAGFTGSAMFETMAFVANPSGAVSEWLNTVFHRVPMLHPNMTVFGYGSSSADSRPNDVCDYGSGTAASTSAVIVWPPPGATAVPGSFDISEEGPTPPAPPGGGTTTGPIVSVFFASGSSGTITSHSIRDASGNPLPDTMIAPNDPTYGPYMMGSYSFYAAGPAASGTTFTIAIAGAVGGQSFTKTWTFTTQ